MPLPSTPRLFALFLLLCTCGSACKQNSGDKNLTDTGVVPTSERNVKYESMPFPRLKYIFENATYLDATFYELPISINQSEPDQIQATIAGVGSQPMNFEEDCKPIGHIWFQVNGQNVEEADIYFGGRCVGYVWYDDGKPAFSNALTEQGANFYLNIFQSVQQNAGQQQ